jgi:hypothetical protein
MPKNPKFGQYHWSFKLPVLIGSLYLLFSTPFLLNLVIPSVHEGNLYSTIFAFMNAPVTYLFGTLADQIGHVFLHPPTLYKYNLVTIIFSWAFWVLCSFITGVILDLVGIGKSVSPPERN